MKMRKSDIVFVIVYLLILFFLLLTTPVTVVGGSNSGDEVRVGPFGKTWVGYCFMLLLFQ